MVEVHLNDVFSFPYGGFHPVHSFFFALLFILVPGQIRWSVLSLEDLLAHHFMKIHTESVWNYEKFQTKLLK